MKKGSTSKNFAILGAANIIIKILAVAYLGFQAAILGNYGNGIVAKGMIIYVFLFSLSNAGLPNAISKLVSEQALHGNYKAAQKIFRSAFIVLLGLGIFVCVIMLAFAKTLADLINQPNAYLMLMVLAPTLIFTSFSCAIRGYLQGRQNMIPVAISNIVEQLFNSVFTVLFAWLLFNYGTKLDSGVGKTGSHAMIFGAAGTAVGTLIGGISAAVFLIYIFFATMRRQMKREIRKANKNLPQPSTRKVYNQIFKYMIPAILNTIAINASNLIDLSATSRLNVAGLSNKAATSLFGVYQYQYNKTFNIAIAFTTALVTSMIPAITEAIAMKNHKLVKHRISESYKAIYLITIPSIVGIMFLAHPVLTLIYPTKDQGAEMIIFGIWTAILVTITYVQSGIMIASGQPTEYSVNMIIGMVAKVVLNYFLIAIPAINIYGAIIGSAVGWLIAIVLNQISIKKKLPYKIYFVRMMIKPAFASAVMGTVCLGFFKALYSLLKLFIHSITISSDISLAFTVLVGGVVFFVVMIYIKGAKKYDILRLPLGGKIYDVISKVPVLSRKLEAPAEVTSR